MKNFAKSTLVDQPLMRHADAVSRSPSGTGAIGGDRQDPRSDGTNEFCRSSPESRHLLRYAELFSVCFPRSRKFSVDYLTWLYRDNPAGPLIGYDAFCDGRLIAHYAAVPVLLQGPGQLFRACWSLNTATHPQFQGRGLFTTLAKKTYEAARQDNCVAVIGVANQNSTHGFIKKLGFALYGQLSVLAGFGMRAEPRGPSLRRAWSPDMMEWRLRNPSQRYYSDRSGKAVYTVVGRSSTPVLLTSLDAWTERLPRLPFLSRMQPVLSVTYGAACSGLAVAVPKALLPSPWNLIYRNLISNELDRPGLAVFGIDLDTF